MLNSVHEPGSNGNSKTSPSRKPGRKTKSGARAPNWPSWHAQERPASRPARPCRAPACPLCLLVRCAPRAPRMPLPAPRALPRPACRTPCTPSAPRQCRLRLLRARAAHQRLTHAGVVPARPSACCHTQPSAQSPVMTLLCIVLQYNAKPPAAFRS